MYIKSGFLFFLFFVVTQLPAQLRLTLDDCIRQALNANPALENQRLEKRVKQNDYIASIGDIMPEVKTEARFGKRFGRAVDPGTNLFATRDFVEGTLNLDISVPLFEGFTRMNKMAFQRINRQMGEWNVVKSENDMAFEVMDAFYQVIFQQQLLELATEQRRLSEHYLQQAEEFVKEGLKAAVDLQEMKARLSSDIYQERVRRNAGRVAMLELKQFIWLKPKDSLEIVMPEKKPEVVREVEPVREMYDRAMLFLPEFRLMELRQKASRKSLAIARGQFVPALRGEIGLYTGYYDTEKNETGGVMAAGKQMDNNLNQYFGLTLSVPLLSGFKNLKGLRKSKLQLQQTQNQIEMERQQMYTEIEKAHLTLTAAVDESHYAGEMEETEKLTLQQAEEKWKEGLIPVFELMESRNRYFTSRAEVVRTWLQYIIKRKTMDFYQGKPIRSENDSPDF